jgi:exodeoxyribonuclease V beta subunit
VLLGDFGPGEQPPASAGTPADDVVAARLASLAARTGGALAVERVDEAPAPARWTPSRPPAADLAVATFGRRLDLTWRRTSYSALTSAAHDLAADASVGSEADVTGTQDEHAVPAATIAATTAATTAFAADDLAGHRVPPMADLPAGAAFGTLVHEVLEHVDTSVADLPAELLRACREAGTARLPGVDPTALAAALEPVLATPLGPLAGGRTLADVRPGDRLAELEFELPVAGGHTRSGGGTTLAAIAGVLRRHLPADDVFADYPDLLTTLAPSAGRVRGYLTGSIDALLRVHDDAGAPRYVVVDYKTNRLAPPDEPLTTWHYRPSALADAMMHAHYPLQLLLYSVAVHRYLRWRQPGYRPEQHLGGGLYLFVRGMCGPETPVVDAVPCGVMGWRPPAGLVVELSAVLDGRQP